MSYTALIVWQKIFILFACLYLFLTFLGLWGRYVQWRFPIVYMETEWSNLTEHLRQHFRRGYRSWLFIRHLEGKFVRFHKYVVWNDPVIYYFISIDWVAVGSPDYKRYSEALEELGSETYEKAIVHSNYNVERYNLLDPNERVKSLEPYMDLLVCRCEDWHAASAAARKAFELAGIDEANAKFFVWNRRGMHSDDVLLDGSMKARDMKEGYKIPNDSPSKLHKPPRYNRTKEPYDTWLWIRIWLRDMILRFGYPLIGNFRYHHPDDMPDPKCFEAALEHKDVLTGRERRLENYMTPGQFE